MDPPLMGQDLIDKARNIALQLYNGWMHGGEPLFKRAEKAALSKSSSGASPAEVAAAYLRDAVSHSIVSSDYIRTEFGSEVERLTRA